MIEVQDKISAGPSPVPPIQIISRGTEEDHSDLSDHSDSEAYEIYKKL